MLSALGHAVDKVVVIPLNSAKKLQNIVTVSPKGGDFTDPAAAVNSITDASVTNLYLVVIGPGSYNLNASGPLVMKEYVSIAGAGEKATKLYGSRSSDSFNAASAIITGATNSSLSNLTVENTGGGNYSTAIYNYQASPDLHNIEVIARDSNYVCGIQNVNYSSPTLLDVIINSSSASFGYGIRNIDNCYPIMTNVRSWTRFSTNSHGLYNDHASPSMKNVDLRGTGSSSGYGMTNINIRGFYHPTISNSYIAGNGSANGYGIYNLNAGQSDVAYSFVSGSTYASYSFNGGTLYADWSILSGPVTSSSVCFGSRDESRNSLDQNCQ